VWEEIACSASLLAAVMNGDIFCCLCLIVAVDRYVCCSRSGESWACYVYVNGKGEQRQFITIDMHSNLSARWCL